MKSLVYVIFAHIYVYLSAGVVALVMFGDQLKLVSVYPSRRNATLVVALCYSAL